MTVLIGMSLSEPHTYRYYENIAVPMYVCVYPYSMISRSFVLHTRSMQYYYACAIYHAVVRAALELDYGVAILSKCTLNSI